MIEIPNRGSTNMSWAVLLAFQNQWFSLGFIKIPNSWTNRKFNSCGWLAGWLAGWPAGWSAAGLFCHWSLLILRFSKISIKILNISNDVWQKWNIVENNESMGTPKLYYVRRKYNKSENLKKKQKTISWGRRNCSISLRNMKSMKIRWTQQKGSTPRMLTITNVCEEKTMLVLQTKKAPLQECW